MGMHHNGSSAGADGGMGLLIAEQQAWLHPKQASGQTGKSMEIIHKQSWTLHREHNMPPRVDSILQCVRGACHQGVLPAAPLTSLLCRFNPW